MKRSSSQKLFPLFSSRRETKYVFETNITADRKCSTIEFPIPCCLLLVSTSPSPRTHHSPPLDSCWNPIPSELNFGSMCRVFVHGCDLLPGLCTLPWLVAMKTRRSGNAKKKAHDEICPFSLCTVRDIVNSSIYQWCGGLVELLSKLSVTRLPHGIVILGEVHAGHIVLIRLDPPNWRDFGNFWFLTDRYFQRLIEYELLLYFLG